ncbi:MAG TPA: hypothetical protein PKA64_19345 [Myxococcota bacterium]|nr:hypothetical protein [Myxococcota bacterium]
MLLLLLACRPAVDAPETVEEQAVFGFVHFDEPGFVEAVAEPLLTFAASDDPDLEDGFLVDQLDADDLRAVGVDDPDITGVVGALGRSSFTLDVDGVAEAVTADDREAWWEGVEDYTIVEALGDRDCFLAHACGAWSAVLRESTRVPVLGLATRTFTFDARWLVSEDGVTRLATRQRSPDPVEMSTTLLRVDQQYGFSVVGPSDAGAIRAEAVWVDAVALGSELPEGYAVRQAVRRMQDAADAMDAAFAAP